MNAELNTAPEAAPTVLVVEDEVLIRMTIADMLRESGLRVVEAGNADEAVNYFKSGALADLVFTDIEMPGAMNGVALMQRLQAEFPSLKFILTSGGPRRPDVASTAPFIAKPYDLDAVVGRIHAILTEPDDSPGRC